MKLKIEQVIQWATVHNSGREISDAIGKYFINEALNELAVNFDSACKMVRLPMDFVENTWKALPLDLVALKYVESGDTKDSSFSVENNEIRFDYTFSGTLVYLRAPVSADILTDYPEVNDLYHPILPIYVGARAKQRDYGSYDTDSIRLIEEFHSKALAIDTRLRFSTQRTMSLRR